MHGILCKENLHPDQITGTGNDQWDWHGGTQQSLWIILLLSVWVICRGAHIEVVTKWNY